MARLCLCIIYVFTACILHHAYYYTRSSFFKFHNMRVYPKLSQIYIRSHNVLHSRISHARFSINTVSQDFTVHIRVRSKSSWCYLSFLNKFYTECILRITITADTFETLKILNKAQVPVEMCQVIFERPLNVSGMSLRKN